MHRLFRRRVFYVRSLAPAAAREKLTQDLADFPPGRACVSLFLFWKPHLRQILDLSAWRAEYRAKQAAAGELAAVFKRAFAASLRGRFAGRQHSVQIQRVFALRHNEIGRRRAQPELVDPLESYTHSADRQGLVEFADAMPEPWQAPAPLLLPILPAPPV